MEDIIKSDLFFFITSIAVVVITVLFASMLIFSFFILRKVNKFVDTVKEEGGEIIEDLHEVRSRLKSESMGFLTKVPAVVIGLLQLFKIKKSRTKSKTKKNDNQEE